MHDVNTLIILIETLILRGITFLTCLEEKHLNDLSKLDNVWRKSI